MNLKVFRLFIMIQSEKKTEKLEKIEKQQEKQQEKLFFIKYMPQEHSHNGGKMEKNSIKYL